MINSIVTLTVAIILVILIGIGYYYIDNVYKPDMNHIVDNIYLGNWADSTNWSELEKHGITHVLTLNKKRSHTKNELKKMKSIGIDNKYICISDVRHANIAQHFDTCVNFIKSSDKVLVHCTAGVSRSVTIVIVYLMREKNMDADEALQFIRTKRRRANPNSGFISQL